MSSGEMFVQLLQTCNLIGRSKISCDGIQSRHKKAKNGKCNFFALEWNRESGVTSETSSICSGKFLFDTCVPFAFQLPVTVEP